MNSDNKNLELHRQIKVGEGQTLLQGNQLALVSCPNLWGGDFLGVVMARINVEDSLYRDNRFLRLVALTGCQYKAVGLMVEAWAIAQNFWLRNKSIPIEKWPNALNPILEVGLAKTLDGGQAIYVAGSKNQFSWLEQRSNAGKSSGEAKSRPGNKNATKRNGTQRASTERNGTQPLPLTLTLNTEELNTNTINQTRKVAKIAKAPDPDGSGPVISAYCSAFKKRYNTNPTITPKDISQVKQIIKAVGYEKALVMVQVYVQMENPWFKKKTHDLQTLLGNIQAVAVASKTGNDPDRKKDPFEFLKDKELCL